MDWYGNKCKQSACKSIQCEHELVSRGRVCPTWGVMKQVKNVRSSHWLGKSDDTGWFIRATTSKRKKEGIKNSELQRLCIYIFREVDAANGQTTRCVVMHENLQRVFDKETRDEVCHVSQLAATFGWHKYVKCDQKKKMLLSQ